MKNNSILPLKYKNMWKEIKKYFFQTKNDCINYFAFSDMRSIRNGENEPKMGQKLSFLNL